jgi:hypothetical protein
MSKVAIMMLNCLLTISAMRLAAKRFAIFFISLHHYEAEESLMGQTTNLRFNNQFYCCD